MKWKKKIILKKIKIKLTKSKNMNGIRESVKNSVDIK